VPLLASRNPELTGLVFGLVFVYFFMALANRSYALRRDMMSDISVHMPEVLDIALDYIPELKALYTERVDYCCNPLLGITKPRINGVGVWVSVCLFLYGPSQSVVCFAHLDYYVINRY
jgi:hypothetical protein